MYSFCFVSGFASKGGLDLGEEGDEIQGEGGKGSNCCSKGAKCNGGKSRR